MQLWMYLAICTDSGRTIIGTIPDNVRHALSVYETPEQLKSEWERRDALGEFVINGVKFTRLELMWVFKKLIGEKE